MLLRRVLPLAFLLPVLAHAQEPVVPDYRSGAAATAASASSVTGPVNATGLSLAPRALTFASSPYTVVSTDTVLTCNATGGAVTITLPAATGSGRTLFIKKTDATTNACTIARAGADTIDGATSVSYTSLNASQLIADTASGIWVRLHTVAMGGSLGGTSNAATITDGTGSISFAGATAARVMTTPDANFTVARSDTANTFTGQQTATGYVTARQTVTASAHAFTCDWNSGAWCVVTLQGTSADTATLSNPVTGGAYKLTLIQPTGSDGTVTWPASIHWPGGVAPVLTTTDAQLDFVSCVYNGTVYLCGAALNFAP